MRYVIVESPFDADTVELVERNARYARACVRDCILRGEAPFASHLLYTQVGILNDDIPEERKLGMDVGFAWGLKADVSAVYVDLGISEGMRDGITVAEESGRPVELRRLPGWRG